MSRSTLVVLAAVGAAVAAPLMPRVCDNYAPLVTCRDSPEVALRGVPYRSSRQAYGSVMQGHKPFPMDHQAIGMIEEYAARRLEKDIAAAHLPGLTLQPGLRPAFWGSHLCSARSLDLRYTSDGSTPRMIRVGNGREVPVYFGITLQLQMVSAWAPPPVDEQEAEHQDEARRRSWSLGLEGNETEPRGEPGRPWAPAVWISHRMDVSYDPSRSFSVQRHTWRTVGGGGYDLDAQTLLEMGLAAASEPPEGENAGAANETAGVPGLPGLPESLKGRNETWVRTALALKTLCGCAGASASAAEADAAPGAGGTLFASTEVAAAAGVPPQNEAGCAAEFDRASDGDGRRPVEEVDAKAKADADAADAEFKRLSDEFEAAVVAAEAAGEAPPAPPTPAPPPGRRLRARAADLLSLRPDCSATFAVSRSPAALLAGTACPLMPESVGWVRRAAAKAAEPTAEERAMRALNGDGGSTQAPRAPVDVLREALLAEGSALHGSGRHPAEEAGAASEAEVLADGEAQARASGEVTCDASASPGRCRPAPTGGGGLRVASFNAWNSNPPSWLYPSRASRWERYRRRMDLFASLLRGPAPAVVALQEVRLDITLGPPGEHGQMLHLAERLPGYQYVAQPATVYATDGSFSQTRDEEGVAILSAYPIVASDYAILSRDPDDERDTHARVCLHAVVATPDPALGLVDVYTVHLPLSDAARNRTTAEVERFVAASRLGSVQILLGDMNDEPHNATMRFWAGDTPLAVPNATDGPLRPRTPFADAWLLAHPEPEPRSADPTVRREALTFPSDDPQKRIDTAFVASMPPDDAALPDSTAHRRDPSTVAVEDAWLIGQDPAPGTEAGPGADHVGMVHAESPLWASDHRGVVFDLRVTPSA